MTTGADADGRKDPFGSLYVLVQRSLDMFFNVVMPCFMVTATCTVIAIDHHSCTQRPVYICLDNLLKNINLYYVDFFLDDSTSLCLYRGLWFVVYTELYIHFLEKKMSI